MNRLYGVAIGLRSRVRFIRRVGLADRVRAILIEQPWVEPVAFIGLLMLFALRQVCQSLCALPPPEGMIWRSPGVPSLLVTYGTASDLFFSGHTAIAVYAALELAHHFGGWGMALGAAFAIFEAATVLVLRAHYTLDVFTGAVTVFWVWAAAQKLAPPVDALIASLAR